MIVLQEVFYLAGPIVFGLIPEIVISPVVNAETRYTIAQRHNDWVHVVSDVARGIGYQRIPVNWIKGQWYLVIVVV